MSIEFYCPSCQTRIKAPDASAGKMARCPKCSAVATIPAASQSASPPGGDFGTGSPSAFPPTGASPHGAGSTQPASPFPSAGTPFGTAPNAGVPNPYAPNPFSPAKPPNPFGESQPYPASPNPYQSPSTGYQVAQGPAAVKQKLFFPAIGMLVGSLITLGAIALTAVMMVVNPVAIGMVPPANPEERIGFFIGAIGMLVIGALAYLLQLVGAICMLRGKNRAMALAGAIGGLMPCNVCCLAGFPFSIWGLVALNSPEVKNIMQ